MRALEWMGGIRRYLRAAVLHWLLAVSTLGGGLSFNGVAYLPLKEVSRELGMRMQVWGEDPKKAFLERDSTRIEFTEDRREIELNGIRVFLGFAVAVKENGFYLAETDFERTLLPLLLPQKIGAVPGLKRVAVDAGHGGKDPGARNTELGLKEKDLALDLAQRLEKRLVEHGFEVLLLRADDRFIELEDRSRLANDWGADLFLSLHFNASEKEHASGIECFALTPRNHPSTSRAKVVAMDRILSPGNVFDGWNLLAGYYTQRELLMRLDAVDRGVKRARFAVLRGLHCPGILIEGGFLSHAEEAKRVGTAEYRETVAEAVAEAVLVYGRTLDRVRLMTE